MHTTMYKINNKDLMYSTGNYIYLVMTQNREESEKGKICFHVFIVKIHCSMQDTGCLGLVYWDDPEGWYGEGGGRGVQDWEHMYTCGRFC